MDEYLSHKLIKMAKRKTKNDERVFKIKCRKIIAFSKRATNKK